jgi:hypothetical protein
MISKRKLEFEQEAVSIKLDSQRIQNRAVVVVGRKSFVAHVNNLVMDATELFGKDIAVKPAAGSALMESDIGYDKLGT